MAIAVMTLACNSPVADGGPCTYKRTIVPATVIEILPSDSNAFDVLFKLDSNAFKPSPEDTVSYYLQNNRYLNAMEMDSLQVKVGRRFSFVIKEIETGHCNPFITQLLMEAVE